MGENEIVIRSAPRWAWGIIDEILSMAPKEPRRGVDVDDEGDLIIEGPFGTTNWVHEMYLANQAMIRACERADDEPISKEEIRDV